MYSQTTKKAGRRSASNVIRFPARTSVRFSEGPTLSKPPDVRHAVAINLPRAVDLSSFPSRCTLCHIDSNDWEEIGVAEGDYVLVRNALQPGSGQIVALRFKEGPVMLWSWIGVSRSGRMRFKSLIEGGPTVSWKQDDVRVVGVVELVCRRPILARW